MLGPPRVDQYRLNVFDLRETGLVGEATFNVLMIVVAPVKGLDAVALFYLG